MRKKEKPWQRGQQSRTVGEETCTVSQESGRRVNPGVLHIQSSRCNRHNQEGRKNGQREETLLGSNMAVNVRMAESQASQCVDKQSVLKV